MTSCAVGKYDFMHDNARLDVSHYTISFLEREENVRLLQQYAYSPDLNICDRMISPMLKMRRQRQNMDSTAEVNAFLDASLTTLTEDIMRNEAENYQHIAST